MLPVVLIPLAIQLGSKLLDVAFQQLAKLPPAKQEKVKNKVKNKP